MTITAPEPVETEHSATALNAGVLPQAVLERIPLNDLLFYDEEHYGRRLEERRLNILRADWNTQKAGVLYISRRRNPSRVKTAPILAVIDGHHRVTIALEKGEVDFPALVWDGLTIRQEAALYAAFGSVLRQSALQVFRARLAAGTDQQAQSLNQNILDAGYALGMPGQPSVAAPFRLLNISMLEKFYRSYGVAHLFNTLHLLNDLFPDEPKRTRDYVIRALSLLQRYYPELDSERLRARVSEENFGVLVSKAKGIAHNDDTAMYHAFGEAIIRAYNKYGGHILPRWNDRVPRRDLSPERREKLRANIRAVSSKRTAYRRKATPAAAKPIKHPVGTRGRGVIFNGRVEDPAARPD